jgi:hypothetical protein
MESSKIFATLLFILLFYLLVLVVINRAITYKGFKIFTLEDDVFNSKLPFIFAGNISVFISLFILIDPFINFITYKINNENSMFYIFSISSIVFIINIILLLASYILSKFISAFLIKINNAILQSVLWLVISSLLYLLTNEFYNQITSSNAFNIY